MWKAPKVIRMDTKSNGILRELKGSTLSADGRPSATWLPFFNLRTGNDGIIIAIGWAGQWFSEFSHDGKGTTDITAGMEHLETMLKPGESIRSPRVLIQYWQGEPMHGQNVFRKFLLTRHVPQVDGKPVMTPVCCGTWGGSPTKEHLEMIKWHRKMILEASRASRFFYGDFFPLTQGDYLQDSWMVCQYHLTDAEEGMILAFRRPESGMTEGTFQLKGVSPGKTYEFEEADTGNIVRYSGAEF